MRPIVVSCGDPSGIGPEVILRAWHARKALGLAPFFVVGDAKIFTNRSKSIGLSTPIKCVDARYFSSGCGGKSYSDFEDFFLLWPLENSQIDEPGIALSQNAPSIIESIETAVALIFEGKARSLVTAPICKKNLYSAGFSFPGHTEFLAHLAYTHTKTLYRPVMMLAAPELRTVPVTIHIPLKQVSQVLNESLLMETAQIVYKDLQQRFGIKNPKLVCAGLNPHAGEKGSMGTEELEIIAPALHALQAQNICITGPLPADTLFHAAIRKSYDAALCMYHDQALIPVKTLGFDKAVNITLGLPFLRTSPDHGTAFDIANSYCASPNSFIAALQTADNKGSAL